MLCFEKRGGKLVVYLEGELDHSTASGLRGEFVTQLLVISVMDFLIVMGGVTFMDSSGIGLVLGRYKLMSRRGGRVRLSRPGARVDRLMGLSGVYDLVEKQS